jgi:hypothetical protein
MKVRRRHASKLGRWGRTAVSHTRWAFPWLCLGLLSSATLADWSVLEVPGAPDGPATKIALTESADGHRLEVFLGEQGAVYAYLVLPPGLQRFSEALCPTFQVDKRRSKSLHAYREGCDLDVQRARFPLGTVEEARIASPILAQLMYGDTVVFRYQLQHVGYAEATFSLQGSKQALAEAIGPEVTVSAQ